MKPYYRILLCLLLQLGSAFAEVTGGVRVDAGFGTKISLKDYNGPNVEIVIRTKEMGTVFFTTVDHENSVAVARTSINSVQSDGFGSATVTGTNRVEVQPLITEHSIGVGTGGLAVSNSNRDAYLLYSHLSGLSVYWFDVLDTRQNEYALLIVPAPRPAAETALLDDAEKINAIDRLEAAGLLGAAEARAKRAAVTNSR